MKLSNYLLPLSLAVLNVYAKDDSLPNGLSKEEMMAYEMRMKTAKTVKGKIALSKSLVSSQLYISRSGK